jgi:putative transposase
MSANPAPPLLATLTEEERARALVRYHLLQPHLEGGVALTTLARAHAVPLRTAQRWVTRYRQEGLAGLVRHARADRGRPRRCAPQLMQLIEALALRKPPPTAAFVHRQIAVIAAQQGWPVPSYRTV